jgi:nucleoside-triphosphatase THEP1
MNILLTGEKGVGKTTCCSALAAMLKGRGAAIGGVICRDGKIHDLAGDAVPFYAAQKSADTVSIGDYFIFRPALSFGCDAIEKACENARLIFIDEFGRLEMDGEGLYRGAVRGLATERALVVVRKSLLDPFKRLFPQYGFTVFHITPENRTGLPGEILAHLLPRQG